MTARSEYTRDQAIAFVTNVLRNPLVLMSVPDREDALALAEKHGITARDLLEHVYKRARNT